MKQLKVLPRVLVAAAAVSATSASAQYYPYVSVRANLEETRLTRQNAIDRCATSIADLHRGDHARRFTISYVAFRSSGMRVTGNVVLTDAGSQGFTCDVDYRGNIRKVEID